MPHLGKLSGFVNELLFHHSSYLTKLNLESLMAFKGLMKNITEKHRNISKLYLPNFGLTHVTRFNENTYTIDFLVEHKAPQGVEEEATDGIIE